MNLNIYKYCENILQNHNTYKAITSLLVKDFPNIKGVKLGEKIIKNDDFEKEIPKTLLNLNNSYLFCQGPPGTGKTFQASSAIVELMRNKKTVAVTANSHKVIHNLLEQIEILAEEKKFNFSGLKKGNKDDE